MSTTTIVIVAIVIVLATVATLYALRRFKKNPTFALNTLADEMSSLYDQATSTLATMRSFLPPDKVQAIDDKAVIAFDVLKGAIGAVRDAAAVSSTVNAPVVDVPALLSKCGKSVFDLVAVIEEAGALMPAGSSGQQAAQSFTTVADSVKKLISSVPS